MPRTCVGSIPPVLSQIEREAECEDLSSPAVSIAVASFDHCRKIV